MKGRSLFVTLASSFIGLVAGFALAWPASHQSGLLLSNQRLGASGLFFGVSVALSLVFLKLQRDVEPWSDVVRALSLMLGAMLCFSLVRQEITLLVYSALWAFPGTFLGTALAKLLFVRPMAVLHK